MDKLQRQYYLRLHKHKQMGVSICNQRADCDFWMVTYHFPTPPGSLTQQLPQNWKRSVFTPIPEIGNTKECSNFSKLGFNNMWTEKFQRFKLYLEKAEEPEIKLPTSVGSQKKQESSRKTSTFALLTMPKPLTVWITTNWKFLQEMGRISWEICM